VIASDWMEPTRWHERRSSFGTAAELYDQIRPSYPVEALRWQLEPVSERPDLSVTDLGAGTGILTRQLVGLGLRVTAVEPDAQMLARLRATTPGAIPTEGSAEAMGLPDASTDAIFAGQAYHWFDRPKAHAEAARVLRHGGVFAPLWNVRDDSVAWVGAYSQLIERDRGPGGAGGDAGRLKDPDFGPEFSAVEELTVRHSVRHTPDTLIVLLRSRSYYITATPQRQAEVEAQVRELAATHPDLAGRAEFDLAYNTYAYRAVRR
jgi:SAM-dependent methyltransferase